MRNGQANGRRRGNLGLIALALLLLAGCSASTQAQSNQAQSYVDGPSGSPSAVGKPSRAIRIAITREPPVLEPSLLTGPNGSDYIALGSAFLAYITPDQQPRPYLAAELPTVANGRWKVLPDGKMETTYTLNPNARWHDGEAVTAQDFVFAYQANLDPAVPSQARAILNRFGSVQAVDEHTLLIEWKEPYMWAGAVYMGFNPLPSHLLEGVYRDDKDAFVNGSQWREQFIGTGPYKLERWDPGSEMIYRAHPGFVLGKPATDEIRILLIQDANAVIAGLLSDSVDVTFTASIGFPQNVALELSGWDGVTEYWRGTSRLIEFQQREWPGVQRSVFDARVRRASLMAIDRQAMVEGIFDGKAPVMHFYLDPGNPAYAAADAAVSKYEYSPQRAAAVLAEAGWVAGRDGVARSPAGEALSLPILGNTVDVDLQEQAVITDNWKAVGITSDLVPLTPQLNADNEYRSKFPAVAYLRRPIRLEDMAWIKAEITLPERRWAGNNLLGYANPLVEDPWKKALGTVDVSERTPLLVQALKVMTEDAVVTPTHLQPRAVAYRKGIVGPQEAWVDQGAFVWNAWTWYWK